MKRWSDYKIPVPPSATGEIRVTCPQCSHLRRKKAVRCLALNVGEGVWQCHHCGWSGSLKAGQQYRSEADTTPGRPKVYRKPSWERFRGELDPTLTAYFGQRGIREETLKHFDIQIKTVYMPQEEKDVSAVCFPYYRSGEVVNVKYRDAKKNFRQEKNAEKIVYGIDDVKGADVIVVVEGEVDKLSLWEAGITYCCSVPDGAPPVNAKNYESKFEYLESIQADLEGAEKVILAVDADEPGQKLEEELARRIGREKCMRVKWPQHCKDANDVLKNFGISKLKECLSRAEPYPVKGLITIADVYQDVINLYREGIKPGYSTGWDKIDKLFRVRLGQVTVVTGIPGHGKSEWVDALLVNLEQKHGWPVALFSPEAVPISTHIARISMKITKKPFDTTQDDFASLESIQATLKSMNDRYFFLLPDDAATVDIDTILTLARITILRHGIKVFVLDPWNDLEHKRPHGMTETEYVGQTVVKIRNFARKHDLHFLLVAHPTKLEKNKKTGEYPIPGPYHISGSANWYNKPDNGLSIFRTDGKGNEVLVRSWKIKMQPYDGKPGVETLFFDEKTKRYLDFSYEKEISRNGPTLPEPEPEPKKQTDLLDEAPF